LLRERLTSDTPFFQCVFVQFQAPSRTVEKLHLAIDDLWTDTEQFRPDGVTGGAWESFENLAVGQRGHYVTVHLRVVVEGEVDVLAVCRRAVLVIEVKSYSGRVELVGDELVQNGEDRGEAIKRNEAKAKDLARLFRSKTGRSAPETS